MSRNFKAYKKRVKGPRPGKAYFKSRGVGGILNANKGFFNKSTPMIVKELKQKEGSIYGDGCSVV